MHLVAGRIAPSVLAIACLAAWGQAHGADEGAEKKSLSVLMEEYRARKEKLPPKETGETFKLAEWCDENSLKSQAAALYKQVLRLDPKHAGAHQKLGHKLVETPGGEAWLTAAEQAEFERETLEFDVPKDAGKAEKFFEAWKRLVPVRVRMKIRPVDPSKAKRYAWMNMRVREELATEVTLYNRTRGTVTVKGRSVSPGKRWTHKQTDWLRVTGYKGEWTTRKVRSELVISIPLEVKGKYGSELRLHYRLGVPDGKSSVFSSRDANKIRKAVAATLGPGRARGHGERGGDGGRDRPKDRPHSGARKVR